VEDGRFAIMIEDITTIVFNDLNFVFPMAMVGTGVEKPGILIPFHSCSDFASLLPQEKFRVGHPA